MAPRSWRAWIKGPKSILPPGARIAAPALPLGGTVAADVEVAFGGCEGGVGGVDTGVAGGLRFWRHGLMGFWRRTIGSRGNYKRRLFSRWLNFIMFLLLLLRLIVCL